MLTCPRCSRELYPHLARRTDDGWACANTRACTNRRRTAQTNAARLEDLAWLAECGETVEGAAHRLGITVPGLQKWCERHAPELWARLGRWAAA